jgi:hypothetical protein
MAVKSAEASFGRGTGRRTSAAGLSSRHSRAVFEAPALVAGSDDLAMMGHAVEERGCHLGIAEHDITPQYWNDCHP